MDRAQNPASKFGAENLVENIEFCLVPGANSRDLAHVYLASAVSTVSSAKGRKEELLAGEIIGTPDELKRGVRSTQCPDPTMEDAFVALIQRFRGKAGEESAKRDSRAPVVCRKAVCLQSNAGNLYQSSARRFFALVRKEAIQIVNDPSSILIAFVFTGCTMSFLFGFLQ